MLLLNVIMYGAANVTNTIIDIFGWDFMQLLWDPLFALFNFFENLWQVDLTPLWEFLFT